MSFENTIFKLEDATVSGRYVNVTPTGSVNSLNVLLRTSAGAAIDTFPVSGTVTANQGTASATEKWLMSLPDSQVSVAASNATKVVQVAFTTNESGGVARMPYVLGNDADARPNIADGHLLTRASHYFYNGTTWDRARGDTANGLDVDVTRLPALVAGTANIGDVDVLTVPSDPFGVNADAASATGSISAKLRFIASTGIPITGTVTVGSHAVTNAGTFVVQIDGAALTALQLIDDTVFTDDAAFTPGTSKVSMAGFQADEASTDSVDEGDAGAARMTLDRKIIVTTQPHTAGGWDVKNCTSGDTFTALTNTAQAIKASAGQFGGYYFYNPNSSAAYINVYNIASGSVTVGTSTPKLNFCVPAGAAANIEIVSGIPFDTAISASATTTGGGNTAPTTALEVMFYYK